MAKTPLLPEHQMRRFVLAFTVAMTTGLAPATSWAQKDTLDTQSNAYILGQYVADLGVVHDRMLALANAIPADKYSWRPAKTVRTVSEVLMHVSSPE
jgi:hypothetical protein